MKALSSALILLSALAAPLTAQEMVSSPLRFGLTAGATAPVGDFSNESRTGFNAGGLVELGFPIVPLSFRLDAAWHQFSKRTDVFGNQFKQRVIAADLNALYTFAPMNPTKFYLIGGLGGYNLHFDNTISQPTIGGPVFKEFTGSSTYFGLNAGAGVRFQFTGFSTFLEARIHNVFTPGNDVRMIPVTVGVVF